MMKMMTILNYGNVIDPFFQDVRDFTPQFAGMKAGDRVLDLCCGTGAQVFACQRRGIIAGGVDISSYMINLASKKLKYGQVEASFFLADAGCLPFIDKCFDFTSVSFGLHDKNGETRDKIISGMKRITKQSGSLICIDFAVPLPNNIYGLAARAIECLVGGAHYQGFKDYVKHGGLEGIMRRHYLKIEKKQYLKGGMVAIFKVNPY
jgi:ubiquinone/menaquinone biosynthesis C-methylase UbiE